MVMEGRKVGVVVVGGGIVGVVVMEGGIIGVVVESGIIGVVVGDVVRSRIEILVFVGETSCEFFV